VDFEKREAGRPHQRIALPNYPFERQRHWVTTPKRQAETETPASATLNWLTSGDLPSLSRDLGPANIETLSLISKRINDLMAVILANGEFEEYKV